MKKSLAVAVGAIVLLAAGMSWAQDLKAQVPITTAPAPSSGSTMNRSGQMDEHLQMMKALHEKLMSATRGGLKIRAIAYAKVTQEIDFSTALGDNISALDVRAAGVATV